MHKKGDVYYYVTSGTPRKWIRLSASLAEAKMMWAQLEGGYSDATGLFSALSARYITESLDTLAESTRRQYRIQANVLESVFGGMTLSEIKPTHIAQYLDNHKSKTSANNEMALMSAMFEKALRWGLTEANPVKGVKRNTVGKRDRYITDEEFKAIREAAPDYIRCTMDIGYLTGMRISDILNVLMQDVTAEGLVVRQEKTGKRQLFTLTPELEGAIAAAKGLRRTVRSMYLICNRKGLQVNYRTFQEAFAKVCVKVGIEDVHFHDIRAKAATDAKKLGQDYQSLLGHANRNMSDRYVKTRETEQVIPLNRKL
jgi:integrase